MATKFLNHQRHQRLAREKGVSMPQHEKRIVLTLWKDCAWESDANYRPDDVMRGYDSLNQAMGELAHYATIYSVNYSQLVLPSQNALRLFATMVYSGLAPVEMFEPKSIYKTVREMGFVWPVEND
jgi:hypothetical protein